MLAGAGATAATVVVARTVAYALAPAPDPRTRQLAAAFPAAHTALVALAALAVAAVLGTALLRLVAIGVRERRALAGLEPAPRLRAAPVVVRALRLLAASALAFASVESYLHYRAGLGFHALHCVAGPMHANAWPILAGLSVVVSAVWEAARHLGGLARRTARAAALDGLVALVAPVAARNGALLRAAAARVASRGRSRAPPRLSVA